MPEATPASAPQSVPPANEEWRNVNEVKQLISQRDQFKSQYQSVAEKLASLEAAAAERESREAQARETAERNKLAETGQYQEIIARNEAKAKAEREQLTASYSNAMIPLYIKAAASDIPNLTPEARNDLPRLLRDYIKTDPTGNAVVLDDNGKPRLGDDGTPYDATKFIAEFVKSRSYLLLDTMPPSHGGGNGAKPASVQGRDFPAMMDAKDQAGLEKWKADDPDGFKAALNEYHLFMSKGGLLKKKKGA